MIYTISSLGGRPNKPPSFKLGSGSSLKSSTPSSLRVGFRARTLGPKLGFAEVYSILTTSTSIEQLFNTTRDICYYRYSYLRSKTIKELILFLYITRFNLKEAKIKQLQQFFLLAKLELLKEELDNYTEDTKFDLISNNKEKEEEGVNSRP